MGSAIEQAIQIVRDRQLRLRDGVINGHAKSYEEYMALVRCIRDLDAIIIDLAKIKEPNDIEDPYSEPNRF